MNQRIMISLILGFIMLIGFFVFFIAIILNEQAATTSVEPGFPFIYLALMVIVFGGVLLGIILRLRR